MVDLKKFFFIQCIGKGGWLCLTSRYKKTPQYSTKYSIVLDCTTCAKYCFKIRFFQIKNKSG